MQVGVTGVSDEWALALGGFPRQTSSPPTTEAGGVRPIHEIPDGIACVYDEITFPMPSDQSFMQILVAQYQDADVAQSLTDANGLNPDANGQVSIYVPTGEPVIIPEMCYPKPGAGAVTLQSTGTPAESVSGGAMVAGILLVVLLIGGLAVLWKRLT